MNEIERWYCALIFLLVLQIVASVVRYSIRLFLVKHLGLDDLAHLITLVISVALCAALARILTTSHGIALFNLPSGVQLADTNLILACVLLYGLGTMALKVALGLLQLRIFVNEWHRYTVYGVMAVSVLYGIIFFFFNLFQCGNPSLWAVRSSKNECSSTATIKGTAYTGAVLCSLSDVIYAVLPILYLRSAHMLDSRTKYAVGGILCLGSLGCLCTFARFSYIHSLGTPETSSFGTSAAINLIAAAGELSIGITCLALTTYKPLFRHFLPHKPGSVANPSQVVDPNWQIDSKHRSPNVFDLEDMTSTEVTPASEPNREQAGLSWFSEPSPSTYTTTLPRMPPLANLGPVSLESFQDDLSKGYRL